VVSNIEAEECYFRGVFGISTRIQVSKELKVLHLQWKPPTLGLDECDFENVFNKTK